MENITGLSLQGNEVFEVLAFGNCFKDHVINIECILKDYCGQLDAYFVNVGITLILLFLGLNWALNWFIAHNGYEKLNWTAFDNKTGLMFEIAKLLSLHMTLSPFRLFSIPERCDLRIEENRIEFDRAIRHRITLAFVLYTAVIIYFSIRN
jgi:hypothetical protein